jgi:hypothetical protein
MFILDRPTNTAVRWSGSHSISVMDPLGREAVIEAAQVAVDLLEQRDGHAT